MLVEYDAASGLAPDEVSPAWDRAGVPMFNVGNYLLQDNTFDDNPNDPAGTEAGSYLSPSAAAGTMKLASAPRIEFRIRPTSDMPFLGSSHYANLAVVWSDDSYYYNVSIDKDSGRQRIRNNWRHPVWPGQHVACSIWD